MRVDKATLDEVTRRVFELEGKQLHFERQSEKLADHIAALAEVSQLPRDKIEAIAYAVTHDTALTPRRKKVLWLAAGLALSAVIVITLLMNYTQQPPAADSLPQQAPPVPNAAADTIPGQRIYIQRAAAAQVLARLSPLKISIRQYEAVKGKYPENLAQLGFDSEEMKDGEYIEAVKILPEGAFRAELTDFFGSGYYVTLKPQSIMGGSQIKWQCYSNLPEQVVTIGPGHGSYCIYEEKSET